MSAKQVKRAARIIMVGAPGVGKGTQAERLMKRFPQVSALSSGDLLRHAVRNRTALGLEADAYIRTGSLVPDDMILRLILSELQAKSWVLPHSSVSDGAPTLPSDDPSASFILDGFPRTSPQAARLDLLVPVNLVISLITPINVILDRIRDRWIHAPSGRVYNIGFNRPKVEGLDDVTNEPLTKREDDKPEIWQARLRKFDETSEPLLEHYDRKGILWKVRGNSSDEISPKLFEEFERRFC